MIKDLKKVILITLIGLKEKLDLYKKIKTETISLSEKDIDLFAYSDSLGINYKILKQFNPWIRDKKITNKSKKTYTIIIPKKHEINIFKTEEN